MSFGMLRVSGIIIGLAFIILGLLATAGILPRVPEPEWAFGSPVMILGVSFFTYGVTGKSRILEKLRASAD